MKDFEDILMKTNWKMLQEQKQYLLRLNTRLRLSRGESSDIEKIDGLVNWIDAIQDLAADRIGEEPVFGKEVARGNDVQAG